MITAGVGPAFASVRDDAGQVLAIARVAINAGWAGITAVEVDESARRRGLGSHVMRELVAWAGRQGARHAYLQVASDNAPALGLYGRMGFDTHHHYHYRLAPSDGAVPRAVRLGGPRRGRGPRARLRPALGRGRPLPRRRCGPARPGRPRGPAAHRGLGLRPAAGRARRVPRRGRGLRRPAVVAAARGPAPAARPADPAVGGLARGGAPGRGGGLRDVDARALRRRARRPRRTAHRHRPVPRRPPGDAHRTPGPLDRGAHPAAHPHQRARVGRPARPRAHRAVGHRAEPAPPRPPRGAPGRARAAARPHR